MSILKTLNKKKGNAADKLAAVAEAVAKARQKYGNGETVIAAPEVNTVDGLMSFVHLTDESKVEVCKAEAHRIRVEAIEFAKGVEGGIANKKIEELLAVSPIMANLTAGSDFDYL